MSAQRHKIAHVPAPPVRRATGRRYGGVSDAPLAKANNDGGQAASGRWVRASDDTHRQATSLLTEAATLRAKNLQSQMQSRRELDRQQAIVFENLGKKVRLLRSVRSKLQASEIALAKADDGLARARMHAEEVAARLGRPLNKCLARSQLRMKRPVGEKVTDDVAHAVQTQANGISDIIQQLQTLSMGAAQLGDANRRHGDQLRADIAAKTHSIELEEQCLALNGRLPSLSPRRTADGEGLHSSGALSGTHPSSAAAGAQRQRPSASAGSGQQDCEGPWRLPTPPGAMPRRPREEDSTSAPLVIIESDVIASAGRNAPADGHQWQQRTAQLLERSKVLLDETVDHTKKINAFTVKAAAQHSELNSRTKHALATKAARTTRQENQLSDNLARLDAEIETLLGQRDALDVEIQQRQGPLTVAKQRLDGRRARPPTENVRDDVEAELEKEFLLLATSIRQLQERQTQVDKEVVRIRQLHGRLRQALVQKQSALALDQQCLELEALSAYNFSSRGGGSVGATSIESNSSNASIVRSALSRNGAAPLGSSPRRR